MSKCRRTACQKLFTRGFYRIWNDPTTELGYCDYCLTCGKKIIDFNKTRPINEQFRYEVFWYEN